MAQFKCPSSVMIAGPSQCGKTKQIIESPLPEDQKVFMLDQLLQRYQGLTKQMKTESA